MKRNLKFTIFSILTILLISTPAMAVPMSSLNFNQDYWTITDLTTGVDGESTFAITIESAGYESDFGLYAVDNIDNPSSITRYKVFDKANEPVEFASVFFKQDAGNWLVSHDKDFNTSTVFSNVFGFYFGVYTGGLQDPSIDYYWYTDSGLNEDGLEHIGTQYLYPTVMIYLDDQYGGGDRDFNDMVVAGTDVAPVPEPATLLLLGTGLMGLVGAGRKKLLNK